MVDPCTKGKGDTGCWHLSQIYTSHLVPKTTQSIPNLWMAEVFWNLTISPQPPNSGTRLPEAFHTIPILQGIPDWELRCLSFLHGKVPLLLQAS